MGWKDVPVRWKIAVCFLLQLGVTAAGGVLAFSVADRVSDAAHRVRDDRVVVDALAQGLQKDVLRMWQWLTDIAATRGLDGLDDGFAEAEENYHAAQATLDRLEAHMRASGDENALSAVKAIRDRMGPYYRMGVRMAQAYVAGGPEAGNRLMGDFDREAETLEEALEPFVEAAHRGLAADIGAVTALVDRLKGGVIVAVDLSLALVACLGWTLARSITVPPAQVLSLTRSVAAGDLTRRVAATRRDEFGELSASMNQMSGHLREVVIHLASAAESLAATSQELSATTAEMAASNDEVSVQSQGVSASASQMRATVDQLAQGSQSVNRSASEALRQATEGAKVIGRALERLGEIASVVRNASRTVGALGEQSERIGDILSVIEDIADQTNLLALNAAIEAARAGEQGRGFAVVADEVRKLAEKTVRATQEIGDMVATIQRESRNAVAATANGTTAVEQGVEEGSRAQAAVAAIEERVRAAAAEVGEIAAGAEQLARVLGGVSINVEQIAQGVEQNAAASGEVARTVVALSERAEELRGLTGRFRV